MKTSAHIPASITVLEAAEAGLSSIEHLDYAMKAGSKDEAAIAADYLAGKYTYAQTMRRYADTFDVETARRHGLPLVNLATEPVSVREVARRAFGIAFENPKATTAARYDMRTRHAALFGGSGPYVASRTEVLDGIAAFVAAERGRRP